jgi:ABC-type multidrug transport system fused ATPase/permease subunit
VSQDAQTREQTESKPAGDFDDRVDIHTDLTTRETVVLLWRCLKLIGDVKTLYAAKILLALLAIIPGLVAPWMAKIVIDQVVLQKPFGETDVAFPPYMMPLVDWLNGMPPMQIMLALASVYALMLVFLSNSDIGPDLVEGADHATQSEGNMNQSNSDAEGVLGALNVLVHIRLSQRLANGLRTRLFERLARLPMKTLDDHRIGDSVYRVMHDAPAVTNVWRWLAIRLFVVVLSLILQIYFIGYSYGNVAPEVVWAAMSLVPLMMLTTFPLSGLMRRVNQKSRAAGAATTNAIEESMSNIQAVQSLGGMRHEKERIAQRSAESFRRFRHAYLAWIGVNYLIGNGLRRGLVLLLTYYVVKQVIAGTMTPGDLGVLAGVAMAVSWQATEFGGVWINCQGSVAAVRRAFFYIDLETEDPGEGLPELPSLQRSVRFEQAGITYPNGHCALRDIDLDLAVGELVAVVGPTGAGKTSLAYLIPAFYRPTEGRVLFDGHDIAEVNVDSLRSQVSYVFQEHLLLSESIRDNLLLANPKATEAEILDACRTAGAMDFIDALPDGLDTVLGRSGDTLSVGQQQRLCIARGLVRNTKILILDEPTAALDPQTENALVRALLYAAKDRLVIVIAHRLSTIRQADRIVFLEDGEIRDIGNHDALMADPDSLYRRFVELQGG